MAKQHAKIQSEALFFASGLAVVAILFLSALNLNLYTKKGLSSDKILGINIQREEEISYWKDLLSENPDYLPGWVELAKLQKEKGDLEGFEIAFDNIRNIDPNSELLDLLETSSK